MGFSWYMVERAVWCCGQSAVFSFQRLWGEPHHQREMIESLSPLHFHSFLLEWINLCPQRRILCVRMCALYADAHTPTVYEWFPHNSALFVVDPSHVCFHTFFLSVFIFQTLICIEDEWSRWKLIWPCQGRVAKTQRMFCRTSRTQVRLVSLTKRQICP